MAPPVLTELLSDPGISSEVSKTLSELPLVELQPGFWEVPVHFAARSRQSAAKHGWAMRSLLKAASMLAFRY
jgi:hypothetical protein